MKKVPKKNVDPVLVDVKRPDFNYKHASSFEEVDLKRSSESYSDDSSFFGSFFTPFLVVGVLVLLLVGGLAFVGLSNTKVTVEQEGRQAANNFLNSVKAFEQMNPSAASNSLEKSQNNLDTINKSVMEGPGKVAFNLLSSIVPVFKEASGFLKGITSLNGKLIQLSYNLEELKGNGFSYFRSNGEKLISELEESRNIIREVTTDINTVRNQSSELSSIPQFQDFHNAIQNYHIGYVSSLYNLEDFLGGVISLLSSQEEQRILLMFQNSSEIRPAGGFLGSYGELIIKDGQMEELLVEDIYWPDHEMNFDLQLIPPEPLQRTTKDWGARDGNWFFDFPTSAETVMTLLESSKIYESKGVRFQGTIALNIHVLESLLEFVGPIKIEEYDMEINEDNFLPELQKEVETGIDKQQGENPKKILSVLAPELMNRLDNLSSDEQAELMEVVSDHIENKDIMFYSRDNNIHQLLEDSEVDGSVYKLSSDFWGSYLAVVNANIAGGKTDIFTRQEVDLLLDVSNNGTTVGDLRITRTNNGNQRSELWYNTENKSYVKVLTPLESNILTMSGNDNRGRYRESYSSDYSYFKTVETLEESRSYLDTYNAWSTKEFGKKGFAGWLITPPGETRELALRYESPAPKNFSVEEGKVFRFVFDKQSGVNSSLYVEINAPVGFVWKESGTSSYRYSNLNTDKRVKFDLTLMQK